MWPTAESSCVEDGQCGRCLVAGFTCPVWLVLNEEKRHLVSVAGIHAIIPSPWASTAESRFDG